MTSTIGHNRAPKRARLSERMREVLALAKAGRMLNPPAPAGCGSQARTAGRDRTIWTLQRRGLLDSEQRLTPAGLAELGAGHD